MDTLNYLQSVKNGQLLFADGSVQSIAHWGDPNWIHIFCVRHAEKDKYEIHDPGLNADGDARSERLGRILSEAGLDGVFATPTRRAQRTAEPAQRRAHTPPVETYVPVEQDEWLLDLLAQGSGKTYLVVGHQATIPHLLNQLKGGGFEFDNIPNSDYGQFYLVCTQGIGQSEILQLRY